MITLSTHERELLLTLLRASNNPDNLAQLFDKADAAAASNALAKQSIRLQNWIDEEKSRERQV